MVTERRAHARLELESGDVFHGWSFGATRNTSGEAVFQTGMVGYPEALTDPSYRGQLLVLTYPSIGNYGVPDTLAVDENAIQSRVESNQIHASALIVADYTDEYSHWEAVKSLRQWLEESGVPAIAGVDTRAITTRIRESGTLLARIIVSDCPDPLPPFADPNARNLINEVAHSGKRVIKGRAHASPSAPRLLVIDCGIKFNQLRILLQADVAEVTVVPWDYDFTEEDAAGAYDGIFISNGPGDPASAICTIQNLRKAMSTRPNRPIFGICLGHQLLALAAGFSTYKLKYGNRGHNQPCIELSTGRCFITSQNHGFAVTASAEDTPVGWLPTYVNANDHTNEGIAHHTLPFFSVQFHPEATAGPRDTAFLFDTFVKYSSSCRVGAANPPLPVAARRPTRPPGAASARSAALPRKVIVLGSGGLSIGQAGEFDYSGSQAIKALREDGVRTVLINPNIATVQTSRGLADKVYFLPVTPENVVKVAEYERPDGILLTFGGQTALNCGVSLYRSGALERLGVKILGTPMEAILDTEDRERFNARLSEIGEPFAVSEACESMEAAVAAANNIGYPVILRAAFALGGLGSGFADNDDEVKELAGKAFAVSSQVLVERSMRGWKEVEYEVVRDSADNCITVCNMENFDPLGVHTGDSIVVAPSQTLSDAEYHMLRDAAIRTVRHLGVVGECNIQYALNPTSMQYCIIEVNARLSRSSALASKATGYPLAFVAAKLALGKALTDIRNSVTKDTSACFEPSLDYMVIKMPRWDLRKFSKVSRKLGSAMKSVGEVMAIGRTFEECFQKALRMVSDNYVAGFEAGVVEYSDEVVRNPTDDRVLAIASGMANGVSVDHIHALSCIDKWFLNKLNRMSRYGDHLRSCGSLGPLDIAFAKEFGFSDRHVAKLIGETELAVRQERQAAAVVPVVKQIDTVAAEFPARTNYLYVTYAGVSSRLLGNTMHAQIQNGLPNGVLMPSRSTVRTTAAALCHDVTFDDHGIVVLGSGAYRIGSSVEFDWCAVSAIRTLREQGLKSVMINYNPETVSTDYDECDRLYFEELSFERVLDIYDQEAAAGAVVSMGGQIPNNIAMQLHRQNVRILGTTPEMIDGAENRYKFSRMLDRIGVDQPQWKELSCLADARAFCQKVGYPVLVRPSFVLSGAAMNVVHKADDLELYLTEAAAVSPDCPVVISKFILEAKEIEVDAVAKKGELMMHVVSEHIENAGVHSGDATMVLPPQDLDDVTVRKVEKATAMVAMALNVTGPLNIQFIAKNNEIKVIECNLRASRSFPFVSKTIDLNLAKLATMVMLDRPVKPYPVNIAAIEHVGVKVAQFSFTRLLGADPVLGVEMASTGEVACFGATREEAYLKGLVATSRSPPKTSIAISIGAYKDKLEFLSSAKLLAGLGVKIIATPGTADFFQEHGVPATVALWTNPQEYTAAEGKHTIDKMLSDGRVDFFINVPSLNSYRRLRSFESPGYLSRRSAVDFNVPLLTNIKCAKMLAKVIELDLKSGGSLPLAQHDVRYSARVVSLPGLVLLNALIPGGGKDNVATRWRDTSEDCLRGGFTVFGAAKLDGVSSPELFDATSKTAAQAAVCDYVLYANAEPGNASVVAPTASAAAGLRIRCNALDMASNVTSTAWLEHFRSWPSGRMIFLDGTGAALSAAMFCAIVCERDVHVGSVRTREDIVLIAASKARGLQITCDVNVEDLYAPPSSRRIAQSDQEALWEHLSMIDAVTGPPTLVLPLLLQSVHEGRLTLDWVKSRLVEGPQRILGLKSACISSTFVEVDLDEAWQCAAASSLSGVKCRGRVRRTVVDGKIMFLDGKTWATGDMGRNRRTEALHASSLMPLSTADAVTPMAPKSAPAALHDEPKSKWDGANDSPASAPEGGKAFPAEAFAKPSSVVSQATTSAIPSRLAAVRVSQPLDAPGDALKPQGAISDDSVPRSGKAWWHGQHILSVAQFSREKLYALFEVAQEMRSMVMRVGHFELLRGKVMAALFYEPSTRTSCSFQAAMQRLGGTCIAIQDMAKTSTAKGESLSDTVRTLNCYTDVVVIRHPDAGSAKEAASASNDPVVNAGDGTGEHPTQALLDVFTIREELGTLNGLTVTFVGDLKNGRTVHSLALLLSLYSVRINYVSPAELRVPTDVLEVVASRGVEQSEHEFLDKVLPDTDVLYVTRLQKERFESVETFDRLKNTYIVTPKTLTRAKDHMIVMHPLPRNDEISPDVDSDPRAVYFRQMEHGMYVRMALLAMLLGKA